MERPARKLVGRAIGEMMPHRELPCDPSAKPEQRHRQIGPQTLHTSGHFRCPKTCLAPAHYPSITAEASAFSEVAPVSYTPFIEFLHSLYHQIMKGC